MSAETIDVLSFDVKARWMTALGEVHVVVAQVMAAAAKDLTDASRPWIYKTIEELLGEKALLSEIVPGKHPSIVILPELALGFDDWEKVDELVRSWRKPIVLLSGFGFTKGERLLDWLALEGKTNRTAAWTVDDGPSKSRTYNGGWCWVHLPSETTRCITFLKTTAEQQAEIFIKDLAQGTYNLSVDFEDLRIFPVICSDLLSGQEHIEERLRSALKAKADTRNVLVAGMLLQPKANDKWPKAIHDLARTIDRKRINICLVNSVWSMVSHAEEIDRWRGYTGAYLADGRKSYDDRFSAVRRIAANYIEGVVARTTEASVLGGPLRWTFSETKGRHIWAVNKDFRVEADGKLSESPCVDEFQFEVLRYVRRLTLANDAPKFTKSPLVKECYESVSARVAQSVKQAAHICQKVLYGECGDLALGQVSPDGLPAFYDQISSGLRVLGALVRHGNTIWVEDPSHRGHLRCNVTGADVLVWHYRGPLIELTQVLRRWEANPKTDPVVVFRKAAGIAHGLPHAISGRRDDIANAPESLSRSVAETRPGKRVVSCDLDALEAHFSIQQPIEFAEAVRSDLESGLAILSHGASNA